MLSSICVCPMCLSLSFCTVYLASYCTTIQIYINALTGALSWSTEKLHTIQVSGSFSVKAGIFRMAERYNTSRWEAGHTLCGRSKKLSKMWTTFKFLCNMKLTEKQM